LSVEGAGSEKKNKSCFFSACVIGAGDGTQSLSCPLHRTPCVHVRLVVMSLLVTPPPLIHLRLCLSSRPSRTSCLAPCRVTSRCTNTAYPCLRLHLSLGHRLSSCPSCNSFLAGCCITSRHAAASRLPALRLSLHRRLSQCPSRAYCLAGCRAASCHAAASHQPAPLPLSTLPPLIVPLF
jgi:hypothetical protein